MILLTGGCFLLGGVLPPGGCFLPATAAGGTHPTGMHSCLTSVYLAEKILNTYFFDNFAE